MTAKKTASASRKASTGSRPRKLRWAIVGCGFISESHIRALTLIPEVEIVAGCDIRPERLARFTELTGVTATYLDWKDLLREIKPDVVDVCTPNGVHAPAVIDALNAGCHAMTEKPMAMTPAECRDMIAAGKKNKRLLSCGFQFRYHPAVEIFQKATAAGDIGDILFAKCRALRRRGVPNWGVFGRKELQGGGPLIDIAVHVIEAAHYCMGSPAPVAATGNTWTYAGDRPSEVYTRWPNWDWQTYNVEDLAIGHIRFDNGAIMHIESSFCANIKSDVMTFELMGTKGGFCFNPVELYTDHAGAMLNVTPAYLPEIGHDTLFTCKFRNFVDGILYGTPLRSPGEAGLDVQNIVNGIYSSAAKGGKEILIK